MEQLDTKDERYDWNVNRKRKSYLLADKKYIFIYSVKPTVDYTAGFPSSI